MAKTPECKVKDAVKALLKKHKVPYCSPQGTAYTRSGVGDLIACLDGHYVEIECKAPGRGRDGLSPLQLLREGTILAAGGLYMVIGEDWQIANLESYLTGNKRP